MKNKHILFLVFFFIFNSLISANTVGSEVFEYKVKAKESRNYRINAITGNNRCFLGDYELGYLSEGSEFTISVIEVSSNDCFINVRQNTRISGKMNVIEAGNIIIPTSSSKTWCNFIRENTTGVISSSIQVSGYVLNADMRIYYRINLLENENILIMDIIHTNGPTVNIEFGILKGWAISNKIQDNENYLEMVTLDEKPFINQQLLFGIIAIIVLLAIGVACGIYFNQQQALKKSENRPKTRYQTDATISPMSKDIIRFCTNCGKPIPNNAHFCTYCGNKKIRS